MKVIYLFLRQNYFMSYGNVSVYAPHGMNIFRRKIMELWKYFWIHRRDNEIQPRAGKVEACEIPQII